MSSRTTVITFVFLAVMAAACSRASAGDSAKESGGISSDTSTTPAVVAPTLPSLTIAGTPAATATVIPTAVPTDAPASPLPTATQSQSPLAQQPTTAEPVYTFEIVAEYPHDPEAWTQGLVYTNSVLYVGTGLHGNSSLRKTDLESGEIYQSVELPEEFFGEGVTVLDGKVYQLTWTEQQGFIYGEDDFAEIETFAYPTEGWGLTHDGKQLIMSDGTSTLYFRDPDTLEESGRVSVKSSFGPLSSLNELEYVNGEVFANVWLTDWIARIDPDTGNVTGWINLAGLLGPEYRLDDNSNILNGIAYDATNDRLLVTGKFWPRIFEIDLVLVE